MVESVIRIEIDGAPAEGGARRVVRSHDAIARKSGEAAEAIGRVRIGYGSGLGAGSRRRASRD